MRKALGRGLDALITATPKQATAVQQQEKQEPSDRILTVPISKIRANHLQPRKHFDPEKLGELAASIKEHGLAQPIVVSYDDASDSYEVIAGERRLRACELAGIKEVEVVVREAHSEKRRLSLAMVENLQREDLNPIEEALGYLRLIKEFEISQGEISHVVGKSKSAVSNTLRLLELPEDMQKALQFEQITEGHARALLMVESPLERKKLFDAACAQSLSVRQVEDMARQANAGGITPKARKQPAAAKPADLKALEDALQHHLGTKVEIATKKDPTKGRVVVHFYSLADFDRVMEKLKK